MAISLILFAQEIVQLLSTKEYVKALPIVPVIIISYVFLYLYTLFANYSFYYKKTGYISLATLVTLVNIVLNYLLIPRFGYIIAAYTTLFSYILLFVFHYTVIRFILKTKNLINVRPIIGKSVYVFGAFGFVLFQFKLLNNIFIIYLFKIIILVIVSYTMFYIPFKKVKS